SMLYRGTHLAAAEDVARKMQLSSGEREFLSASHALADRERSEGEQRAARQARQNRRLRLAVATIAIALVLALPFGVYAAGQTDRANRQRDRTRTALLAAEVQRVVAEMPALLRSDRSLAGLLAREAVRLEPGNPDAQGALLTSVTDEPRLETTM